MLLATPATTQRTARKILQSKNLHNPTVRSILPKKQNQEANPTDQRGKEPKIKDFDAVGKGDVK